MNKSHCSFFFPFLFQWSSVDIKNSHYLPTGSFKIPTGILLSYILRFWKKVVTYRPAKPIIYILKKKPNLSFWGISTYAGGLKLPQVKQPYCSYKFYTRTLPQNHRLLKAVLYKTANWNIKGSLGWNWWVFLSTSDDRAISWAASRDFTVPTGNLSRHCDLIKDLFSKLGRKVWIDLNKK